MIFAVLKCWLQSDEFCFIFVPQLLSPVIAAVTKHGSPCLANSNAKLK